jgi:hypothetical protein
VKRGSSAVWTCGSERGVCGRQPSRSTSFRASSLSSSHSGRSSESARSHWTDGTTRRSASATTCRSGSRVISGTWRSSTRSIDRCRCSLRTRRSSSALPPTHRIHGRRVSGLPAICRRDPRPDPAPHCRRRRRRNDRRRARHQSPTRCADHSRVERLSLLAQDTTGRWIVIRHWPLG